MNDVINLDNVSSEEEAFEALKKKLNDVTATSLRYMNMYTKEADKYYELREYIVHAHSINLDKNVRAFIIELCNENNIDLEVEYTFTADVTITGSFTAKAGEDIDASSFEVDFSSSNYDVTDYSVVINELYEEEIV
jgi:hypothetical protein